MSRVVKTLIFVLFVGPGPLIGLVPYLLSGGWHVRDRGDPLSWLGIVLIAAGAVPLGESIVRFVREGRGTPAPYAETETLIVTGFYRWVRNPMYVGVLSMIFGQALLFGSTELLIYGAIAALGFHLWVIGYEEPRLHNRHGARYAAYCRAVRRWLPVPRHTL